jgi:hypothetical protein
MPSTTTAQVAPRKVIIHGGAHRRDGHQRAESLSATQPAEIALLGVDVRLAGTQPAHDLDLDLSPGIQGFAIAW